MSRSITIRSKGQITLPREVREAAHLSEGSLIQVEMSSDGSIILRPQTVVDASQAWFWTAEWQKGEMAASADIAAGRVEPYKNDEDFLSSLVE